MKSIQFQNSSFFSLMKKCKILESTESFLLLSVIYHLLGQLHDLSHSLQGDTWNNNILQSRATIGWMSIHNCRPSSCLPPRCNIRIQRWRVLRLGLVVIYYDISRRVFDSNSSRSEPCLLSAIRVLQLTRSVRVLSFLQTTHQNLLPNSKIILFEIFFGLHDQNDLHSPQYKATPDIS